MGDQPDWISTMAGQQTALGPFVIPANGHVDVDVTPYESVTFSSTDLPTAGHDLIIDDLDTLSLYSQLTTPAATPGIPLVATRLVIPTNNIRLTNQNAVQALTYKVIGTAKTPPKVYTAAVIPDVEVTVLNQAYVAGQTYIMGFPSGGGPAQSHFRVGGTVIKGIFQVQSITGIQDVADTVNMWTNPSGDQTVYVNMFWPANAYAILFKCTVGGSGVVRVASTYGV